MKKKLFIEIIIFIVLFLNLNHAKAYTSDDILMKQLDNIDDTEIKYFVEKLNEEYRDYIPKYEIKDFINIRNKGDFNFKDLLNGIIRYVFREVLENYHLIGVLISIAILCAILKNIQTAFENTNIAKVTYSVVYLVLISIAVRSFSLALNVGKAAIDQMVTFIQALMPIILTLLASVGGMTSIALFNPLIVMSITIASTWIKDILLPVIFFASVLGVISNISIRFNVSFLANFLKQICVFLLGLFMSIFLGVLVVNGAASSTIDGITIRTAKFASKNFIPIIGGIFSDTVDTIVGCSLILKNGVGIFGLILVFIMVIFPVIKILSLVFIYKLAGVVIQPVGEDFIAKCLNDMANSLILIFVAVASVAIMFFVTITVILSAGNTMFMMR